MQRLTETKLKELLLEAKAAHSLFELAYGKDEDWPLWYARFILHAMQDEGLTHIPLRDRLENHDASVRPFHLKDGEVNV